VKGKNVEFLLAYDKFGYSKLSTLCRAFSVEFFSSQNVL